MGYFQVHILNTYSLSQKYHQIIIHLAMWSVYIFFRDKCEIETKNFIHSIVSQCLETIHCNWYSFTFYFLKFTSMETIMVKIVAFVLYNFQYKYNLFSWLKLWRIPSIESKAQSRESSLSTTMEALSEQPLKAIKNKVHFLLLRRGLCRVHFSPDC